LIFVSVHYTPVENIVVLVPLLGFKLALLIHCPFPLKITGVVSAMALKFASLCDVKEIYFQIVFLALLVKPAFPSVVALVLVE